MAQRTQLQVGDELMGALPNGAYREVDGGTPLPFPLSIIWYEDATKAQKILELAITRNAQQLATVMAYKVYDLSGVLQNTFTETITYSGVREVSRTLAVT